MTMVFKANNPAMLKNVKPGDKIKFSADSRQEHRDLLSRLF